MREIKFRAWDKKYDDFINDGYIIFNGMIYRDERDFEDGENTNDIELMQYTGLKDKNSVEIYEGDIIKETVLKVASRDGEGIGKYHISEVTFNPYFGFSSVGRIDRIKRGIDELEVIGNIYENPELLETNP